MRSLLAALALILAGTGCIVRLPGYIETRDRAEERRCPPGHTWSDGRCHEKGRGHDRER
jgi:hypothetical protein